MHDLKVAGEYWGGEGGGNLFGERDSTSEPYILNNSRHEIQNKSFKKTVDEIMREKIWKCFIIKIYQKLKMERFSYRQNKNTATQKVARSYTQIDQYFAFLLPLNLS